MAQVVLRVVDVYVYRIPDSEPEYLLLKRAPDRPYAGTWRMIGGKIREGESAWRAALRELAEETALEPRRFWSVPSVNAFYEWAEDRLNLIPVFAAEVAPEARVRLSSEHVDARWFRLEEAVRLLVWPEQRRLIRLVHELFATGGAPEELFEIPLALALG
ncbi:MAG: NUDIX domain-containing protein [Bacteroidetes bacterium]|nr:NUDIX domain-containing protein [Rhodothermia bacterium]MCS7155547.1 NUDIX domain-containing protein [Bacteroidota bacterium]MCX7906405.1 NUDIX domain-containing protein [Bacteroidota bacterium]MDW8137313.1 NUDIX domain-containing protein [Bacteroidota bacterium]MDW8284817.1 NUDIX domain-containing protein [Bacteroidota bacterium]